MKLALAALLVSTIAHADPHVTAIGDATFAKEPTSGWSIAVAFGELAKKNAPLGVLVQIEPGTGISGMFHSAIHATIVRGAPSLTGVAKPLPPGSIFNPAPAMFNGISCAPNEPAACLIFLDLPNGFDYAKEVQITPKKVKVKDLVQPVKLPKQPEPNPGQ